MEEGLTFQCVWCWKVDCLTTEVARLKHIVMGMEIRMTSFGFNLVLVYQPLTNAATYPR